MIFTSAKRPSVKSSSSRPANRSEEHTSELQSRSDLVCRLLLEKKKNPRDAPTSESRTTPVPSGSTLCTPRAPEQDTAVYSSETSWRHQEGSAAPTHATNLTTSP